MEYRLPKTVTIDGKEHEIRTDFRVILDIMEVLGDQELDDYDKTEAMLDIFYVDPDAIEDTKEAIRQCILFINGGEQSKKKKGLRLVDWTQDFKHIIAPVNRTLGYEARAVPYDSDTNTGGLHWWTFLAAFMEIGNDCVFSYIVNIREKKARGKKLEKNEREWYRRNRELVDFETKLSDAQENLLKEWS